MNLVIAWPWLFAVLPLPLLVYWFWPAADKKPALVLRIPLFSAFVSDEGTGVTSGSAQAKIRRLLAVIGWLLLVTAAARPQQIGPPLDLPLQGRNLMLAVDISGSMEQDDMILNQYRVSRLTAVKAVAGDFIERREGDRIGLILFAQQAFLQAPLTFDRSTVRTLMDEAVIGLAGKETAIGDAIALAVKRLREQPEGNRILVLLTDGANSAGYIEPRKAAEVAAAEGIRIYTIGVGGEAVRGSILGVQVFGAAGLDEATLQFIAKETGGQYFRARDLGELQNIYRLLDQYEPIEQDKTIYRVVDELYHWPLLGTLLLSLLMAFMMLRLRLSRSRQAESRVTRQAEHV